VTIAVLGWGSLLWAEGVLDLATAWSRGGPQLPIEFSRVSESRAGALTLVLDPQNGEWNSTWFAISSQRNLNDAIRSLSRREHTDPESIGYVNCRNAQCRSHVLPSASRAISDWAAENDIDAVIWTDLPSNFGEVDKTKFADVERPNMAFTVDNAVEYLYGLRTDGAAKAREYIKKAPPEVDTPLRQRLHGDPWLDE